MPIAIAANSTGTTTMFRIIEPIAQRLDVFVQAESHVAQLLADAHLFLLEALDLFLLLGRQDHRRLIVTPRLHLRELLFRALQLFLDLLLRRRGSDLPRSGAGRRRDRTAA